MNIKVKEVVKYDGHNVTANGAVNLGFKAGYSELVNTISLFQLLNNDVTIKAKLPDKKPFKLGIFRVKQIVTDGDGESKIKFSGLSDYIEMDNLNQLPVNSGGINEFIIQMEADVEEEDEKESGE